jgi:hypothetical protein
LHFGALIWVIFWYLFRVPFLGTFQELLGDYAKKKHRIIALGAQCRVGSAHHETFMTGFEGKYGIAPVARTPDGSHGKRKHQDSSSRGPVKQYAQHDPTGVYSADDMHALNEAFQDESTQPSAADRPQTKNEKVNQWTYGQVPEFDTRLAGPLKGVFNLPTHALFSLL